ncbi:uncharacterized protein LY79DRAFT_570679 [Colletotrichum navitas]|uniref:Uncharacterized protein n=1 Tax=Colletotrichum navitas TaxID=681940 RepID=A0AAD8UYS1_9PEZI|nr:uncharacterized protein LY79DRAFT_570679 [Colletotrichum navitas]KAK1570002.1 hypothetical protein LY79DRAFT_570679 [Colletotrichum navitas]
MTPPSGRSRSRTRIDPAMRARQLRRFHKHLDAQRPNHQDLLNYFSAAVLDQINTLIDHGVGWETPEDGETDWEPNWTNKASLSAQLQHVSRWYDEKKAGDDADADAAAAAAAAAAGNHANRDDQGAAATPPVRPSSEPPSAVLLPPLSSLAARPSESETLPRIFSGLNVQGSPPTTATKTKTTTTMKTTRGTSLPPAHRRRLLDRSPARATHPPVPPPLSAAAVSDDDARDMERMRQEMYRFESAYQKMEPEFLATLEATKAASLALQDLADKREVLAAARRETSDNKAAMEACKADAKRAKRAVATATATATAGSPGGPGNPWQREDHRDERRRAWREARDAWLDALEREHGAYDAVTQALEAAELAARVEEKALQEWSQVLKSRRQR